MYLIDYDILDCDLNEPISEHLPLFYKNNEIIPFEEISVYVDNNSYITDDISIITSSINRIQIYYDPEKITNIKFPKTYKFKLNQIDSDQLISCYSMFEDCFIVSPLPELNLFNAVNMDKIFKNCKLIETIENIINTEKIISMSEAFNGCINLKLVENLDTSNVVDTSKMFFGCEKLNRYPNFNLSNVQKVDYMFTMCSSMTGFIDESEYWKNKNITEYQFCFSKCFLLDNYRYIPIEWGGLYEEFKGNISTSETEFALEYTIVDTKYTGLLEKHLPLFYINGELSTYEEIFIFLDDGTITTNIYTPLNIIDKISFIYTKNTTQISFKDINILLKEVNYIDTRNFTSMEKMFLKCSNLVQSPKMDTSNVTNMLEMFKDCDKLEYVTEMNTSNVTNMNSMFFKCINIKTIPELNTSKVYDASFMFYYCINLQLIPSLDTTNFIHVYHMYENCYNMEGIAFKSHYWENPNIDIKPDVHVNCFKNCILLDNYRYIPLYWGGLGEILPDIKGTFELEYEVINNSNYYISETFPTFYEGMSTISTVNKIEYESVEITLLNGNKTDNIKTFINAVKSVKIKYPETTTRVLFNSRYIAKLYYIDSHKFISCNQMFRDCINLTSVELFDTSNVIDMDYMFHNCEKLSTIPEFNTSKVTDMLGIFYGCKLLRTIPEIDTSNVKILKNAFYDCINLFMLPNINTDNITEINYMFYNCSKLTYIPTLDIKNIFNLNYTFYNCENLLNYPLINTENVTQLSHTFYNCKLLIKELPEFNYTEMKDLSYTFYGCSNMTGLIESDIFWKNENIPEYYYCFKDCTSLINYNYIPEDWGGLGLPIPEFDPTKSPGEPGTFMMQYEVSVPTHLKLEDYLPIFEVSEECTTKSVLELLVTRKDESITHQYEYMNKILKVYIRYSRYTKKISFKKLNKYLIKVDYIDTSELTDLSELFYNCTNLESLPSYLYTENALDASYMFYRCFKLKESPDMNIVNVVNTKGMYYKCASLLYTPLLDLTNAIDTSYMFCYCVKMEVTAGYNTINAINMEGMYYNCHNITSIPYLELMSCENMSFMFYGCNKLISVPNLEAPNLKNVKYMFYDCQKLTSAPYLLNTENIEFTQYMFYNCKEMITALEFSTSNVKDMSYMFYNCINMMYLPILDTTNVTSMSFMFFNCFTMTGIADGDNYWNKENINYHYKTFTNCINLDTYNQIPKEWK